MKILSRKIKKRKPDEVQISSFAIAKKYRSNRSPNITLPTLSNAVYSKSLRGIPRQVSLMEEMAF